MGKTKTRPFNMNKRSSFHKNIVAKHGVRVQIIIDNIEWDRAIQWEIHWIKSLRAAGYPLVNHTEGGDGTKGLAAHNRRKVLCLETGEVFDSGELAAEKFNLSVVTISNVCNLKCRSSQGLHFVWRDYTPPEDLRKKEILEIEEKMTLRRKRVAFHKSNLSGVVHGKDLLGRKATGPMKTSRRVLCLTTNEEFPSASAAARHYNISRSSIIELCLLNGRRKSAGGKQFRYMDDA
jgi:hypothetical protein